MPPSNAIIAVFQLVIMALWVPLAIVAWVGHRTQRTILRQSREHLQEHQRLNEQLQHFSPSAREESMSCPICGVQIEVQPKEVRRTP